MTNVCEQYKSEIWQQLCQIAQVENRRNNMNPNYYLSRHSFFVEVNEDAAFSTTKNVYRYGAGQRRTRSYRAERF